MFAHIRNAWEQIKGIPTIYTCANLWVLRCAFAKHLLRDRNISSLFEYAEVMSPSKQISTQTRSRPVLKNEKRITRAKKQRHNANNKAENFVSGDDSDTGTTCNSPQTGQQTGARTRTVWLCHHTQHLIVNESDVKICCSRSPTKSNAFPWTACLYGKTKNWSFFCGCKCRETNWQG